MGASDDDAKTFQKAHILSTIMRAQNYQLSAWQHRTSIVMKHEGLSDKGLSLMSLMSKCGMATSATSVQAKSTAS
jgi:tetrahydromethanopterin S-methyltransferase subunit H